MGRESSREDSRGGFTIFPADWFAEETLKFVSLGAHGLWINLLLLMHRSPIRGELRRGNGSKIDGEGIAIILGRPASEIVPILQELITEKVCLTLEDGTICNRRMLDEKTSKEKHHDAGLLGALARWGNDSNPDSNGIANAKSDSTPGKERKGKEGKGSVTQEGVVNEFDVFWQAYPKKVGKKEAAKQWTRAKDKPSLEVILAALKKQKASEQWLDEGGKYIPDPERWIKKGRWADEVSGNEFVWKDAKREGERLRLEAASKARDTQTLAFSKVKVGDKASGPEGVGVVGYVVGGMSIRVNVDGYGWTEIRDMATFGKWTFSRAGKKEACDDE